MTAHGFDPQWKFDLAEALGYTTATTAGDQAPTIYRLPIDDPFTFLENTNEVIAWEADGPDDEHGHRLSHVLYPAANTIALKPVRYPMPDGFELVTITADDGTTHRIALRKPNA